MSKSRMRKRRIETPEQKKEKKIKKNIREQHRRLENNLYFELLYLQLDEPIKYNRCERVEVLKKTIQELYSLKHHNEALKKQLEKFGKNPVKPESFQLNETKKLWTLVQRKQKSVGGKNRSRAKLEMTARKFDFTIGDDNGESIPICVPEGSMSKSPGTTTAKLCGIKDTSSLHFYGNRKTDKSYQMVHPNKRRKLNTDQKISYLGELNQTITSYASNESNTENSDNERIYNLSKPTTNNSSLSFFSSALLSQNHKNIPLPGMGIASQPFLALPPPPIPPMSSNTSLNNFIDHNLPLVHFTDNKELHKKDQDITNGPHALFPLPLYSNEFKKVTKIQPKKGDLHSFHSNTSANIISSCHTHESLEISSKCSSIFNTPTKTIQILNNFSSISTPINKNMKLQELETSQFFVNQDSIDDYLNIGSGFDTEHMFRQ